MFSVCVCVQFPVSEMKKKQPRGKKVERNGKKCDKSSKVSFSFARQIDGGGDGTEENQVSAASCV